MFRLLLLGSFALATAAPSQPVEPMTLFTFEDASRDAWQVVNDGVMGGRSEGYLALENGALQFTGTLVTQGGGFTSVRTAMRRDLSAYDGIELRVRGGGRPFELEVDDGTRSRGRTVSRRGAFQPTTEWSWVRVPFSLLQTSLFGQPIEAPPLDPARVRGIGLYILDGQDGPFRLEVDTIRAYRDTD